MTKDPWARRSTGMNRHKAGRASRLAAAGALALLAAALALALQAAAQTPPPASGDWVVADSTSLSSQTVVINGNVTVRNGGSLDLTDVTLRLNSSYPGEFGIFVERGGQLNVTRGSITAATAANGYTFQIYGAAKVEGAVIERMWGSTVEDAYGIQIYSSGVVIANSTIQYGYRGNVLIMSGSPVLRGNLIRYALYAEVDAAPWTCGGDLTFEAFGVVVANGSSPTFESNRISYNGAASSFADPWRTYYDLYYDNASCWNSYYLYEYFVGYGLVVSGASAESTGNTISYNSQAPSSAYYYLNGTSISLYRYSYDPTTSLPPAGLLLRSAGGNFTGDTVDSNAAIGIHADGGSARVSSCTTSNHNGGPSSYYGYGLFISGGGQFSGCSFSNNYYPVYYYGGGQVDLESSTFSASPYEPPITIGYGASGILGIYNTSFSRLTYALNLQSSSGPTINFYNSTVGQSQIYGWGTATVNIYWLLQYRIIWVNGAPVSNAPTTLTDKEGRIVFLGNVDADGKSPLRWAASLTLEYTGSSYPDVTKNTPLTLYVTLNGSISDPYTFEFNATTYLEIRINDPYPPSLTVFYPLSGQGVNTPTFTVRGNVFDIGSGVKIVRVSADGSSSWVVSTDDLPGWSAELSLADGVYDILVEALDYSDSRALVVLQAVVVDTRPPGVQLLSPVLPASGEKVAYTNQTVLLVKGTIDEDAAVTLNGAPLTISGGLFAVQLTLNEGPNFFHLYADDALGNRAILEFVIVSDTIRPSLVITSPADNLATNRSAVLVAGTTETDLTLTLDGVPISVSDGSFNRLHPLQPGLNLIWVNATDKAQNRNAQLRRVTYDPDPPVIDLRSPSDGLLTRLPTVEVAGQVEPSIAFVHVNGVPVVTQAGAFSLILQLQEGPNLLVVRATDTAGNEGTVVLTVTLDTSAPVLVINSPSPGAVINTTNVRLRGSIAGASILTVNGNPVPFTSGELDVSVPIDEGEHELVVVATDAAGNEAVLRLTITRDTAPPIVRVNLPERPLRTTNESVLITGTAPGATTVFVNGIAVAVDATGNFTVILRLNVGDNAILLRAVDAAGNSDAISREVIRELPPPPPAPGLFGLGDASYALLPVFVGLGAVATHLFLWRRRPKVEG